MVRLSMIVLSFVTLITAFQNCGTGGGLTLESSSVGKSGFTHLLGACSALPAGGTCDERWSKNAADLSAFQASCNAQGVYQAFQCPETPDLLGVCERLSNNQLHRMHYYSGFSQGATAPAQEAASAQAQCAQSQGVWQ